MPTSYLPESVAETLLLSSHAVSRWRERAQDSTSSNETIQESLKQIARDCPATPGEKDVYYVRVSMATETLWLVIKGRVIRTVLTHRQYLKNIQTGRAH